ncbi:MAG: hypothetical protein ACEQSU_11700 [Microgenomates group bacterium]
MSNLPKTIDEYEKDPAASKAEKGLIAACRQGQGCSINDGALPAEKSTDANITVRADLIRLLAIEATSLHTFGVYLKGALITGTLDLQFAKCRGLLALNNCRFDELLRMAEAELALLSLDGSHLPGLFAPGAKVTGSVLLRGMTAVGTVDVSSAQISGQLALHGATLDGKGHDALNAQGATVNGNMMLNDVVADGEVNVVAAQITGQLNCQGATLNGKGGRALGAQSLRVESAFVFRQVSKVNGVIDLASANVGELLDDPASWAKCYVLLDGFVYDRIIGIASAKTLAARNSWLQAGSQLGGQFFPQPYTQFAKVMRAAGHAGEARKALMARDQLLAIEARKIKGSWDIVAFPMRWIWDTLLRLVAGYGFNLLRASAIFLALLTALAAPIACAAWQEGSFAPNSDVILVSQGWQDLLAKDCLPIPAAKGCIQNPANDWSSDPQAGMDWDSFSAFGYAADLVVPILDLGQTAAWAPSKDRGPWGAGLWWGRWVFAALGWLVTALGAAAITGVIQRNAPD